MNSPLQPGLDVTVNALCPYPEVSGATGTITSVDNGSVWVALDTGHFWLMEPNELETTP